MAEVVSKVADKNVESLNTEGSGEAEIAKVLASRRLYEYLTNKLNVVKAIAENKNFKIFGN